MTSQPTVAKRCAMGALWLFVALRAPQAGELPPAPKNYFNDYAAVTRAATRYDLNERLAKFDRDTTNQIVVAIFPQMDSKLSVDAYTLRVANAWGVGQRGKNNGVALFVFIHDRTMRIHEQSRSALRL